MQGAGEGAAAEDVTRLGLGLEQLGERLGDVLEDLAVLLGREPRGNADVADEELVVVATHREPTQIGAAREKGFELVLDELAAGRIHDSKLRPPCVLPPRGTRSARVTRSVDLRRAPATGKD